MTQTTRTCTLCDATYRAGMYSAHASAHIPLRKGRQGVPQNEELRLAILGLRTGGLSQADIARQLGVSRQRVHQIVHTDRLGRMYRADAKNAQKRKVTP